MKSMNLVEAIYRAAGERLEHFSDINSYEAFTKFNILADEQKELVNELFETLLAYKFTELLNWCGGEIPKPITRNISITWSIEDVKEVRPDLSDEQAAHVLELLLSEHDANYGINWDVIEAITDMEYPKSDEECEQESRL